MAQPPRDDGRVGCVKFRGAMSQWWISLPCVLLLAGVILVPGLGTFGLWEPHERQLSARVAPSSAQRSGEATESSPTQSGTSDPCLRQAPKDAVARTLAARAPAWGRDHFGDSDAGRRLPFALLGILCVLASAGIASRMAGARAGVITALVLLSMPLLVLQSRQLNSEIGTAAGTSLIVYGLLAIHRLERVVGGILPLCIVERRPSGGIVPAAIDGTVGGLALAAGIAMGFASGGALLGVLVPTAAFAALGGLGIPTLCDLVRWCRNRSFALAGRITPRWTTGRAHWRYTRSPDNASALVAAALACVALVALLYQVFDLREPAAVAQPIDAQRTLLGKALAASGCYSPALGAIWRADDDLRYAFDSSFEQIAYGTFPWGVLAPIAIASLLFGDSIRRRIGALALGWAGSAWIATELFQRKVGFTLWAGFPALAIAIGCWLDGMLHRVLHRNIVGQAGDRIRHRASVFAAHQGVPTNDDSASVSSVGPLVGIFAVAAILVMGKDLQSFTVRLSSLLVGGDAIAYPAASAIGPVPVRMWIFVLGLLVGLGVALASTRVSRFARIGIATATSGTIAISAFWAFGWQPALAVHLSSKAMFDRIRELAKPGDTLVIMGEAGEAASNYAPRLKAEVATTRQPIVAALGQPRRAFAIVPQSELCPLHREFRDTPYYLIDNRNARSLVLSNKIDGAIDQNPLRTAIVFAEPPQITARPSGRIVWDNRIELLGWDIPRSVRRGSTFTATMYYKVLQPIGGSWKVLFHFDGTLRFNGDHEPIGGRCQTATWQPGDYIVDRHTVVAGNGSFAPGPYEVWTGFFAGSAPNFRNMPIAEAPAERRDSADRVKIETITLR